jgi:hypothetical protein
MGDRVRHTARFRVPRPKGMATSSSKDGEDELRRLLESPVLTVCSLLHREALDCGDDHIARTVVSGFSAKLS